MTVRRLAAAAALLPLLFSPGVLHAQDAEGMIGDRWRVAGMVGFIVENPSVTPEYTDRSRAGVTAGVIGFRPMSGNLSLSAGASYTRRVVELAPYPFFAPDLGAIRLELSYMELPISMRVATGDGSRTRLRASAGLTPALLVGSSITSKAIGAADSVGAAPREAPASFDLSIRLAAELVSATDSGYEFFVGLAHTRGLLKVFDGSNIDGEGEYSYRARDLRAYIGFGVVLP